MTEYTYLFPVYKLELTQVLICDKGASDLTFQSFLS